LEASICQNERAIGLEAQCNGAIWHNKAEFVQIVLEVKSQEPLVTENICININCIYIIEAASHQI